MANPNSPFGFRPISRVGGLPYSLTAYGKQSSETTAIFQGDMVAQVGAAVALSESPTGYNLQAIVSAYDTGNAPAVGTGPWLGVAADYGAASVATQHHVVDEIDAIFLVQGKTGTTYSTASHVGLNANISLTTPGSTTTKQSGMTVDGATISGTSSKDLRLRRIAMISPNVEGANNIFEVTINNHVFGNSTTGQG